MNYKTSVHQSTKGHQPAKLMPILNLRAEYTICCDVAKRRKIPGATKAQRAEDLRVRQDSEGSTRCASPEAGVKGQCTLRVNSRSQTQEAAIREQAFYVARFKADRFRLLGVAGLTIKPRVRAILFGRQIPIRAQGLILNARRRGTGRDVGLPHVRPPLVRKPQAPVLGNRLGQCSRYDCQRAWQVRSSVVGCLLMPRADAHKPTFLNLRAERVGFARPHSSSGPPACESAALAVETVEIRQRWASGSQFDAQEVLRVTPCSQIRQARFAHHALFPVGRERAVWGGT